jgi:phosphohistidine phosphatase
MKELFLMRHAKSSWKNSKLADPERPLTRRGEKDAEKMADLLKEKKLLPDVILTSTARRARETAGSVLKACRGEITYIVTEALYMAETRAIIECLQKKGGDAQRVLVIGHNPGLEMLLQYLTGQVESLPTSSIVSLQLPIDDWSQMNVENCATAFDKWTPKEA